MVARMGEALMAKYEKVSKSKSGFEEKLAAAILAGDLRAAVFMLADSTLWGLDTGGEYYQMEFEKVDPKDPKDPKPK